MNKQEALKLIDTKADMLSAASDKIWGLAELSLQEYKSEETYEELLKKEGFAVQHGLCGIETAVTGTYGSGHPIIGILAEYDALSGLSQQGGKTEKQPEANMVNGHGCGHNLLGVGALGAAIAVKEYLKATGKEGTVIFYGCPGEEGGAAKAFFARDNEWTKLDAAITWHPDDANQVVTGSSMACIQKEYIFSGVASHAAGAPELGRSALDAAELMNIGVQFLREHMNKTASVHYAFTNVGGVSPNVVQSEAKVLYMVRDATVQEAIKLEKRVDKIAEGAAMMTETQVSTRFIDGTANPLPLKTMEQLLYKNFKQVALPEYTEEEWEYANTLKKTYTSAGLPGYAARLDESIAETVAKATNNGERALNDFLMPLYHSSVSTPGSTDVGDVSWQTPTGQINCVTAPSMTPGHSWQMVSAGTTSIAHKGMLTASKVLAATAIDIIDDPSILVPIREEFEKASSAGYVCPIPKGAKPEIV